ncbi:M56 family metallopeptidase [Candidatus Sumerlaeota bacterium]
MITWPAALLLLWCAVAAAMIVLVTQRTLFVSGLVAQSRAAAASLPELLEDCRRQLGLKKPIALRLSGNVAGPAVCGLFRPVILLPEDLPEQLDERQLRGVLLHELAHVKRADMWANVLQTLLQIAYFYNPLLWLANAMIRRVREQAVDEMVLVAMGREAQQYPDTLVRVARLCLGRPTLALRLIGVVESPKTLAGRIKHMVNRPLPKTAKLGLAGLLAVVIAAAVLLPMAKGNETAKTEEPESKKGANAIESSQAPPSLRKFQVGEHAVEAGFLPDKAEYVWGEPIYYFTYVVKNVGKGTLSFHEGGDYRGGRSESHRISAVDAEGNPVPIPRMGQMGGIMQVVNLEPGEVYRKSMPVSRRLTFSGPGIYTVTGKRTLIIGERFSAESIKIPTATSFQLTIHPHSVERMRKVVENLSAQIRAAGELRPRPVEYTEPTEMTDANRLHLAFGALVEIGDDPAIDALIALAKEGSIALRIAALKRLGNFAQPKVMATVLEALRDQNTAVRAAAATALGSMKTDAAIDSLLDTLSGESPEVVAGILRAMGNSQSPRVFNTLVQSLNHSDSTLRTAAVDGLVAFGGEDAIEALKTCLDDEDMDFREMVVIKLVSTLKQSIDLECLLPVIRARKHTSSLGQAPTLLRRYAGEKAVPMLLSCLDFADPSIRGSYNYWIVYSQGWCQGGMKIPWISDLNRDDTPQEIEQNRKTLKEIKIWVEHYFKHRMQETPIPEQRYGPEYETTWGDLVDGIQVRATIKQRVWPQGMPQLVTIDIRGDTGGTYHLKAAPQILEVEINGEWYTHQPPLIEPTMGIDAGHGKDFHNLMLDSGWRRKSDNQPLQLPPGKYSLRLRLSIKPEDQRTGLATSKATQFEVIAAAVLLPMTKGKTEAETTEKPESEEEAKARDGAIAPTDKEIVQVLIKAMRDKDLQVQGVAAQALVKIGPANIEIIKAFIRAAREHARYFTTGGEWAGQFPHVARACQEFFRLFTPEQRYALPELTEMAKDAEGGVRMLAFGALVGVGEVPKELAPVLLKDLQQERGMQLRRAAEKALCLLGPKGEDLIPQLEKMLKGKSAEIVFAAARVLVAIGTPNARKIAADGLIAKLKEEPRRYATSAASILSDVGKDDPRKAIAAMRAVLLASPQPDVSLCWSLLELEPGSKAALDVLEKIATDPKRGPYDDISAAGLLVKHGRNREAHAQFLLQKLADPEDFISIHGATAILRSSNIRAERDKAFEAIFRILKERKVGDDAWAAGVGSQAFKFLGPEDAHWAPQLQELLKRPVNDKDHMDERIRARAQEALANIEQRPASETKWGKPLNGLQASISAVKKTFALDEPILVRFKIENAGQQDRAIIWHELHYSPVLFEIGKKGEKRQIREDFRRFAFGSLPAPPERIVLRPGESKEATFDLRRFNLQGNKAVGIYQVTGLYAPKLREGIPAEYIKKLEAEGAIFNDRIDSNMIEFELTDDLTWLKSRLAASSEDFWVRLRTAKRLAPLIGNEAVLVELAKMYPPEDKSRIAHLVDCMAGLGDRSRVGEVIDRFEFHGYPPTSYMTEFLLKWGGERGLPHLQRFLVSSSSSVAKEGTTGRGGARPFRRKILEHGGKEHLALLVLMLDEQGLHQNHRASKTDSRMVKARWRDSAGLAIQQLLKRDWGLSLALPVAERDTIIERMTADLADRVPALPELPEKEPRARFVERADGYNGGGGSNGILFVANPVKRTIKQGEDITLDLFAFNPRGDAKLVCIYPDPDWRWMSVVLQTDSGKQINMTPPAMPRAASRPAGKDDFFWLPPGKTIYWGQQTVSQDWLMPGSMPPGKYTLFVSLDRSEEAANTIPGYQALCAKYLLEPWHGTPTYMTEPVTVVFDEKGAGSGCWIAGHCGKKIPANGRWSIRSAKPLAVVAGWYAFDEKGLVEYGGIATQDAASAVSLDLLFKVRFRPGVLTLKTSLNRIADVGRTAPGRPAAASDDIAVPSAPALRMTSPVLTTTSLDSLTALDGTLQPLWKVEIPREGKSDLTLVYAARALAEGAPAQLFDPNDPGEALRIGREWRREEHRAASPPAEPVWGEVVDGLRASISAEKKTFALDEPIPVRFTIENAGQEDRAIVWHELHYSPVLFEIGKKGEKRQIREDSRRGRIGSVPAPPERIVLRPGESKEATFDLRRFLRQGNKAVGSYQVTGLYAPKLNRFIPAEYLKKLEAEGAVFDRIDSNMIEFELTDAPQQAIAACLRRIHSRLTALAATYPQLSDIKNAELTHQRFDLKDLQPGASQAEKISENKLEYSKNFTWGKKSPHVTDANGCYLGVSIYHPIEKNLLSWAIVNDVFFYPEARIQAPFWLFVDPKMAGAESFSKAIKGIVKEELDALAETLKPNKNSPELAWGEAVAGLRAAVEFVPEKETYLIGDHVDVRFHLENVGDKAIQIARSRSSNDPGRWTVEDADGREIVCYAQSLWHGPGGIDRRILSPGEKTVLDDRYLPSLSFGEREKGSKSRRTADIHKAGTYSVSYKLVFNRRAEGDRAVELRTGKREVMIERPVALAETLKPNKSSAELAWGEPVDGLRLAVEFLPEKKAFLIGEKIYYRFQLENVSDKPIQLVRSLGQTYPLRWTIEDAQGREMRNSGSMRWRGRGGIDSRTLAPGERVALECEETLGLASPDNPRDRPGAHKRTTIEKPGRYFLRCTYQFSNRGEEGSWKGALVTGKREVMIARPIAPSTGEPAAVPAKAPAAWATLFVKSPIRSVKEYEHVLLGDKLVSCELEIRSAKDNRVVLKSPRASLARKGGLTEAELRQLASLPDGEYLVALTVDGARCSNVATFKLAADFDPVQHPTLTVTALDPPPGQQLPLLGLRAIGPTPEDPKLLHTSVAFPVVTIDGVDHSASTMKWAGPDGPLRSGETRLQILDLEHFAPPIKPGRHTIKIKVGKYESAPITVAADWPLARQWDAQSPAVKSDIISTLESRSRSGTYVALGALRQNGFTVPTIDFDKPYTEAQPELKQLTAKLTQLPKAKLAELNQSLAYHWRIYSPIWMTGEHGWKQ